MRSKAQIFRYIVTGGVSFVFEYAVFLLAVYGLSMKIWLAQAFSYGLALIVNFSLLRYWAFRHGSKGKFRSQVPKYLLLAAFNLPVTTYLIDRLNSFGLKPFVAKLVVIGFVVVWNYAIYNKLIFRHEEAGER